VRLTLPAPIGNGSADFTTKVDISAGDHVVALETTGGNTQSVLSGEQNGGVSPLNSSRTFSRSWWRTIHSRIFSMGLISKVVEASGEWTLNYRVFFTLTSNVRHSSMH